MADRSKGGDDGVRKQVASEHRRLATLFRRTRRTLARPRAMAETSEVFRALREAIEGHFVQEDSLYYPPIWVLRPQYKDALEAFVLAHDDFRKRLAEIAARLVEGVRAEALATFDAFVDAFSRHEAGEEQLLERIEREIRPG